VVDPYAAVLEAVGVADHLGAAEQDLGGARGVGGVDALGLVEAVAYPAPDVRERPLVTTDREAAVVLEQVDRAVEALERRVERELEVRGEPDVRAFVLA